MNAFILKTIAIIAVLGLCSSAPFTQFYQTPYGSQVVTSQFTPNGGYVYNNNGPGFSQSSYSSGDLDDDGYHMSSMSTGMGGMNGMSSMSSMSSGVGMGVMQPMQWWPSMFGNQGQQQSMGVMQPMQPMQMWPSMFGNQGQQQSSSSGGGMQWWPSLFG